MIRAPMEEPEIRVIAPGAPRVAPMVQPEVIAHAQLPPMFARMCRRNVVALGRDLVDARNAALTASLMFLCACLILSVGMNVLRRGPLPFIINGVDICITACLFAGIARLHDAREIIFPM